MSFFGAKPKVDVTVNVGETWTCHVCGRTRPDSIISVRKFVLANKAGTTIQVNVRYCNDTPSCFEGTTDVAFLKSAQQAFGE